MREPVLGPNAKPFFIQFAVGLCALAFFSWAAGDFFYWLSCRFVTGTC